MLGRMLSRGDLIIGAYKIIPVKAAVARKTLFELTLSKATRGSLHKFKIM